MTAAPKLEAVPSPASGLPERMRKARIDRGMTQRELADYLHVKQAAVSMIESGEDHPDEGLSSRISSWIGSGGAPKTSTPRGPYKKRATLP